MLTRMEQKIEDIKKYMDEKFEHQQSYFSAMAEDICLTVFESFEKLSRSKWKNKMREYQS